MFSALAPRVAEQAFGEVLIAVLVFNLIVYLILTLIPNKTTDK